MPRGAPLRSTRNSIESGCATPTDVCLPHHAPKHPSASDYSGTRATSRSASIGSGSSYHHVAYLLLGDGVREVLHHEARAVLLEPGAMTAAASMSMIMSLARAYRTHRIRRGGCCCRRRRRSSSSHRVERANESEKRRNSSGGEHHTPSSVQQYRASAAPYTYPLSQRLASSSTAVVASLLLLNNIITRALSLSLNLSSHGFDRALGARARAVPPG